MPDDGPRRVEVIIGVAGRRYWPAHEKLRIVEESLAPRESVSAVASSGGVAPNLLFRWRRLMSEGEAMAVVSIAPGFAGTPLTAYRKPMEVLRWMTVSAEEPRPRLRAGSGG